MDQIKISLVHPSRKRPIQCLIAATEWINNAVNKANIEYILSLDTDDSNSYIPIIAAIRTMCELKIVVNPNNTMVEALGKGTAVATGDIIINVSDDFSCPNAWDVKLFEKLKLSKYTNINNIFTFFVNDGFQRPYNLQTICIVSRGFYNRFGYIYNPAYKSMFADTEYTEICKLMDCIVDATDMLFEHKHYAAGKSKIDETYQKQNSKDNWNSGREIFNHRKISNFGLGLEEILKKPEVVPPPPPPKLLPSIQTLPQPVQHIYRPIYKPNQLPAQVPVPRQPPNVLPSKIIPGPLKWRQGKWIDGKWVNDYGQ